MKKRPLTQREIRKQKKDSEQVEYVILVNKTKNQTLPIQLKSPKGVDWFIGEQSVNLYPKRMAKFPKPRLYPEQIDNYAKAGRIRIIDTANSG